MKLRHKIRRNSVQFNRSVNVDLNLSNSSKAIISTKKYSASPRNNLKDNCSNSIRIEKNNNKVKSNKLKRRGSHKHITVKDNNTNKYKFYQPFQMNMPEMKRNKTRKNSVEFMGAKTKKFFEKYSLEDKGKLILYNKYNNYLAEPLYGSSMNKLENNIKNVLNNMKLQFEKQNEVNESEINDINFAVNLKSKFSTNTNLKFTFKKKKINNKNKNKNKSIKLIPYEIKNRISLNLSNSSINDISFNRSHSFEFTESFIKKILKRMRAKINRKSIYEKFGLTQTIIEASSDEEINSEESNGFSFHPHSTFILIFEIMIIFSNIYSFIFIPLRIAKNDDIRGAVTLLDKIIVYLIDIIYILDIIISFFKGYFNNDMVIIRNNKKIILHYLDQDFFKDLLEAVPLNMITKVCNSRVKYFAYSDKTLIFLKLLAFIKPFKIFKIIRKKNNFALELFYGNFSDSYHLESFIVFVTSLFIFFLFFHLFICLHIFFSLQSYPNWITHINVANKSFYTKYITSFYFLMTTMTTVGYGDIVCISPIERIFHIILLAIGTIIYTFLVSKIGNYLRDQSHEQIKLSNDLNILETIRVSYPTMPFKLYFKIKSHLLNISKKKKKTGISTLINGIPEAIKNDLLFKIYENEINKFSIFKNVNNSNFILQVLTSFIPITLKKEEILLLEGELVENIIFVKDGRLSMEMSVDLKEPYNSIQRYLEFNFKSITKNEMKSPDNLERINSLIKINKNYNDLKQQIDNFLLDKQKSFNNNNSLLDNNISTDIGRLDFTKKESDLKHLENYDNVKIFDVRKNENFGEVHMFLHKPSPFTLKAKSRMAEVLLLRQHEAIIISNNFPNIWRHMHNKSYHNLISLKKLTFKKLQQYYNSHFYSKESQEHDFSLNLDISSNGVSFLDRPSFLNKIITGEKLNLIKSNKNSLKSPNIPIKHIKSSKISNSNKISLEDKYIRKSSAKTNNKKNKIHLGKDSLENSNFSSFNIDESLIKPSINGFSKDYDAIQNSYNSNNNLNKNLKSTKTRTVTFKKDIESKKEIMKKPNYTIDKSFEKSKDKSSTPKNEHSNTSIDYYKEIIHSISDTERESNNLDTLINQTLKYNSPKNSSNIEKKEEKIFTLKDIDERFSKKIRKKIKMRKKLEKLRYSFELERKENNKNLVELYSSIIAKKLDPILQENNVETKNLKNNIAKELINVTFSQSNTQPFTEIMDSSSSEEIIQKKFDNSSLKDILSISFEIKSSYKNINKLSKGEIIRSSKYRKTLENLIKNNKIFKDTEFKTIVSKYTAKFKKHKNKYGNFTRSSTDKNRKINKNNKISLIQKSKFKYSSNNLNNYFNDKKIKKIKSSFKKIDDNLDDKKKNESSLFKPNIESEKNERNNTISNSEVNTFKENKVDKKLINLKNLEINSSKNVANNNNNNNSTLNNNKTYISSLNFFNELDKDNILKSENKLEILNNKNHNYINTNDNNIEIQKENCNGNKCIIF